MVTYRERYFDGHTLVLPAERHESLSELTYQKLVTTEEAVIVPTWICSDMHAVFGQTCLCFMPRGGEIPATCQQARDPKLGGKALAGCAFFCGIDEGAETSTCIDLQFHQ